MSKYRPQIHEAKIHVLKLCAAKGIMPKLTNTITLKKGKDSIQLFKLKPKTDHLMTTCSECALSLVCSKRLLTENLYSTEAISIGECNPNIVYGTI